MSASQASGSPDSSGAEPRRSGCSIRSSKTRVQEGGIADASRGIPGQEHERPRAEPIGSVDSALCRMGCGTLSFDCGKHFGCVAKLQDLMRTALSQDALSADSAARLVDKLQLLCSSLFGRVGQPLLHPLHSRAAAPATGSDALNSGLRSALTCLLSLLQYAPPKVLPLLYELVPRCRCCTRMLISSSGATGGWCLHRTCRRDGRSRPSIGVATAWVSFAGRPLE